MLSHLFYKKKIISRKIKRNDFAETHNELFTESVLNWKSVVKFFSVYIINFFLNPLWIFIVLFVFLSGFFTRRFKIVLYSFIQV